MLKIILLHHVNMCSTMTMCYQFTKFCARHADAVRVIKLIIKRPKLGFTFSPKLGKLTVPSIVLIVGHGRGREKAASVK